MKRLVIERMNIRNFKGVRELDISFGEKVTRISGMNGTGKTTIPDAFSWCIWNKDSRGNAPGTPDFREKPLDENGNEMGTTALLLTQRLWTQFQRSKVKHPKTNQRLTRQQTRKKRRWLSSPAIPSMYEKGRERAMALLRAPTKASATPI